MPTDRRSFLKTVSAVGGAAGLGVLPKLANAAPPEAGPLRSPRPVTTARVPCMPSPEATA